MLGHDPISFLIQKTGHFTEYLILALVLYRALRQTGGSRASRRAASLTLAAGVIFAVSDEWHQSFVPHREPTVRDILIDLAGILAALALSRWLEHRRARLGRLRPHGSGHLG